MFPQPATYDKRLYSVADYEQLATQKYFRHATNYYNSGANHEVSLRSQGKAYA